MEGLECVFWAHFTEYLLWVHLVVYLVKELVAIPVMGAVADHYGGYAFGTMMLASTSKDRASRIW